MFFCRIQFDFLIELKSNYYRCIFMGRDRNSSVLTSLFVSRKSVRWGRGEDWGGGGGCYYCGAHLATATGQREEHD